MQTMTAEEVKVTRDEAASLAVKAQHGDIEARDRLIAVNGGLCRKIANKFKATGLDPDDRFQEAQIGLMKAVDKFDPSRGVMFSTFATFMMRREIRNAREDTGTVIRHPQYLWRQGKRPPNRVRDEKLCRLGDVPDRDHIEAAFSDQEVESLRDCIASLPERERFVIQSVVIEGRPMTWTAEKLGYSREWISHLRKQAISRLRQRMLAKAAPRWAGVAG